jgi:hypothetical protein
MSKSDSYEVMCKSKSWHHDIKMIDGESVEAIVQKYQKSQDEKDKDGLLNKIIENYAIFRPGWANAFAQYLDNDPEAGALMHDEIIWRSASKFDRSKTQKVEGKAFNAYLVSALLNSLKNYRNTRMSHKNHPRVRCPACEEEVYQIDAKHLRHRVDFDRYKKLFANYPLTSRDGLVTCPITGESIRAIGIPYLNRLMGRYTLSDFYREFPEMRPPRGLTCPVTGMPVEYPTSEYPPAIMSGYTEDEFVADFPDFGGIIRCPFTGRRMLHPTQAYLDEALKQDPKRGRVGASALDDHPMMTTQARKSPVYNPYSEQYVPEITVEMLRAAGTTVMEHLEKFATIVLGKYYPEMTICPFTGRKTHSITREDVEKLGKTPHEFYHAACKYPLRRWRVMCALCSKWVDNVWEHLDEQEHHYAQTMTYEEFERSYGSGKTKVFVTTNCFVEGDSGDSTHIADLLATEGVEDNSVDVEDSLLGVAHDEMDKRIAHAVRVACTVEDVFCASADKTVVRLPFKFQSGQTKAVKAAIKAALHVEDFDIVATPKPGDREVSVMTPGRDSLRGRLLRMIGDSDLVGDND